MRKTLPDETIREALDRVGAALDKWGAEQRLRKWARNIAAGEVEASTSDQATRPLLGRGAENR
jgi:hypothetical protein